MRISDWSSDVCSSDLVVIAVAVDITHRAVDLGRELPEQRHVLLRAVADVVVLEITTRQRDVGSQRMHRAARREERAVARVVADAGARLPGEELGAVVDDETQDFLRTVAGEGDRKSVGEGKGV